MADLDDLDDDETVALPDDSLPGRRAPEPRTILSERFKLGRVLGEGGMGIVHEAEDTHLDRPVAVKRLKPKILENEEERERFVREARVMARLAHPGMVPVYDAGALEDNVPFYAMERVQGQTLSALLRSRSKEQLRDRSSILKYVDLFERVCQTMAFAHANHVIHRDLKPGNVMIDDFGAVLVMDWGLAKEIATEEVPWAGSQTRANELKGTPAYMSPEQARGLADASDCQSDVFALGAMLYEILTGRGPFTGDSPVRVLQEVMHHHPEPPVKKNPSVSRELSAICMKALAKDPRRRYPSARELTDDIRRFREFLPVSAIRPRPIDRAVGWVRRNPVLAASLGTLILAAGAWLGIARIESHSRSSVVERMLGMVRSDQQELDTLLREVRDLRAVPDAGPEAEARLAKLRARVAAKQTELRGKVGAIVGLTLPTPDPRALELARTESFRLIELLVELGDHAAASVFIESILEQYDDHNVLRFSDEEIRRLRELAAEVESQGRRRSRRQSGHLGVGSESRYRVS